MLFLVGFLELKELLLVLLFRQETVRVAEHGLCFLAKQVFFAWISRSISASHDSYLKLLLGSENSNLRQSGLGYIIFVFGWDFGVSGFDGGFFGSVKFKLRGVVEGS